jgi:hypothetical protein
MKAKNLPPIKLMARREENYLHFFWQEADRLLARYSALVGNDFCKLSLSLCALMISVLAEKANYDSSLGSKLKF